MPGSLIEGPALTAFQDETDVIPPGIGWAPSLPRMVEPDVPDSGRRPYSPCCNEGPIASELGIMDEISPAVREGHCGFLPLRAIRSSRPWSALFARRGGARRQPIPAERYRYLAEPERGGSGAHGAAEGRAMGRGDPGSRQSLIGLGDRVATLAEMAARYKKGELDPKIG